MAPSIDQPDATTPLVDNMLVSRPPPPDEVDVLIIGSGPAGLTLATALSHQPQIRTAILERRPTRLLKGHADGLQVRSLEMFQALGFAERVIKEGYHVNEMTFWEPDGKGGIYRASRHKDTAEGISEMPHVILTQARLHEMFLDRMAELGAPVGVFYGCAFAGFKKVAGRDGAGEWSKVSVQVTDSNGSQTSRTIRARYVVGCDGAHSPVRTALSIPMPGDSTNSVWGVMDALIATTFPDLRFKVGLRSATEGAMLIIPKAERDHMATRIYVELDRDASTDDKTATGPVTADTIAAKAAKIFHPYSFEVREVLWWSRYDIGQRLCPTFDNATVHLPPTVFVAGDACHTHSPKAGQGMNTSMADAFNLAWKLTSVISGLSSPQILRTYSTERHAVAAEMVAFDKYLTSIFSSHASSTADADADAHVLRKALADKATFTAGTGTRYEPSCITARADDDVQDLARGFPVGMRFHSALVLRVADACPVQLGHVLVADGRWRIVIFAGADEPGDRASRTWKLCEWLETDPHSPVRRYTPDGADEDAVVEVLAVYRVPHADVDAGALQGVLRPAKRAYCGLRSYKKVFTNRWVDGEDIGDVYEARGVDRKQGAVVVVRPDQYVASVLRLDDFEGLMKLFGGFMVEQQRPGIKDV